MGQPFFLMEHDEFGDETAAIIVDSQGTLILEDIWNGFDDITIEQLQESILSAESPQQERPDRQTLTIYQLGDRDEAVSMRFMNYDYLNSHGFVIEAGRYNAVYTGPMVPGETLEDIYTRFNLSHPDGYQGHSLSVSDVVVLHKDDGNTAYFVDSFGFKEIPDFFPQEALYQKASAEQDTYRAWLLTQPPEEILNHAYEYITREDI